MRSFLVQLFFLALLGAAFVWHTEETFSLLTYFFTGGLWFFLGLMLLVGGIWAYLKYTGRTLASLGIQAVPDAGLQGVIWVGMKGQNVPLAITQKEDGLHVEWASMNYWWIMGAMSMFGPGMLLAYLIKPQAFHFAMPFPMLVMFAVMWAGAWVVLGATIVKFFFHKPELILSASSLVLLAGKKTRQTVWQRDVENLTVRATSYATDHGPSTTNYVLIAQLADGKELGLCITDNLPQIEGILTNLKEKGYKVIVG